MKARMMAVACDRLPSGVAPTMPGYMYAADVGMLIAMLRARLTASAPSALPGKGLLFGHMALEPCMGPCPPRQGSRQDSNPVV